MSWSHRFGHSFSKISKFVAHVFWRNDSCAAARGRENGKLNISFKIIMGFKKPKTWQLRRSIALLLWRHYFQCHSFSIDNRDLAKLSLLNCLVIWTDETSFRVVRFKKVKLSDLITVLWTRYLHCNLQIQLCNST